jgi:hypothetical protein
MSDIVDTGPLVFSQIRYSAFFQYNPEPAINCNTTQGFSHGRHKKEGLWRWYTLDRDFVTVCPILAENFKE